MTKVRTLAQVEDEIRRSRNAHDASTYGGRSRTDALIAEADRLRKPCDICGLTEGRHRLGCVNDRPKIDTSQLGRICIDPNDDRIRADMVREALRRSSQTIVSRDDPLSHSIDVASAMRFIVEYADDIALSQLYRMLNP